MTDQPAPEAVALARRLYVEREPVQAIVARTGLARGILYRCLAGDFPDGSGIAPAPIARRTRRRPRKGDRAALVERMWQAAARQVGAVERRLAAEGLAQGEDESSARTLAIVAKTLRELAAFDAAAKSRGREVAADDDDDAPHDIEELRRALADKLEKFAAERSAAAADEAD